MKTIIIGDLKNKNDNIVPYGLGLAKSLNSEVIILQQGKQHNIRNTVPKSDKYSPVFYKDDQKVMGIEFYNYLDIEFEELHSNLNIELFITDDIISEIEKYSSMFPGSVVVLSKDYHQLTESTSELINFITDFDALFLFIEAGKKYEEIQRIVLPDNFNTTNLLHYIQLKPLISNLRPEIYAIGIPDNNSFEMSLRKDVWENVAKKSLAPSVVKTNIIENTTLYQHIKKNNYDAVFFINHLRKYLTTIVNGFTQENSLVDKSIPVLIYKATDTGNF